MRTRAFSLIEITVVIALVVMIGGLVFPALTSRIEAERVSSVSREVLALGLIARGEAARSDSGVSLYLLLADDGVLRAEVAHGTDLDSAPRERVYGFPPGWSLSQDNDPDRIGGMSGDETWGEPILLALYLPDGTIASANPGVVVTRDEAALRISVSALTGEVRVEPVSADATETEIEPDDAVPAEPNETDESRAGGME